MNYIDGGGFNNNYDNSAAADCGGIDGNNDHLQAKDSNQYENHQNEHHQREYGAQNSILIVPDEGEMSEKTPISSKADSSNRLIVHKESCNLGDDENNPQISRTLNPSRGNHTVGDLLKMYKNQMPLSAASTNPRKNPLLKSKGCIREDWSVHENEGPSRSMIGVGNNRNMPYSTLQQFNDRDFNLKTKTMVHHLNYSSFNYSASGVNQNQQQRSGGGVESGGGNNEQYSGNGSNNAGGGTLLGDNKSSSGCSSKLQQKIGQPNLPMSAIHPMVVAGPAAPGNTSQSYQYDASMKSFKNSSDTLAYGGVPIANNQDMKFNPTGKYLDSRQGLSNDKTMSNNPRGTVGYVASHPPESSLRTSQITPPPAIVALHQNNLINNNHLQSTAVAPGNDTASRQTPIMKCHRLESGQQYGMGHYRSQTPQLRQRKAVFNNKVVHATAPNNDLADGGSGGSPADRDPTEQKQYQQHQPVSKLSNFILQLYNKIVSPDQNSNQEENEKKVSRCGSEEIPQSSINPQLQNDNSPQTLPKKSAFKNSANCLQGYSKMQNDSSKNKPRSKFTQKRVRIQENQEEVKSDQGIKKGQNNIKQQDYQEESKYEDLKYSSAEEDEEEEESNGSRESSGSGSGRNKYKKWMTEQANFKKRLQESSIIQKRDQLIKVKTQKEILIADGGDNQDIDKMATSKSYIYMPKGLSNELFSDQASSLGPNYRSAFFENDKDLEEYHKQLKEALMVQFQKEINISSHSEVKRQYEGWVKNYQEIFAKKSPFKKTLVFDLDETLVRVQRDEPKNAYDTRINVVDQIYVKQRPYLIKTLKTLRKHYELILFTAASDQYADIVLQSFEGHSYFDHILSRKQCLHIYQKQVFIKDLSILLGGRVLRDIIIVDNKIESYSSNLENGIPIVSYYGEEDGDIMLKKLTKYLIKLCQAADVRECIKRDFYLEELAGRQKSNVSRIFDTNEIKACVLKSREDQQQKGVEGEVEQEKLKKETQLQQVERPSGGEVAGIEDFKEEDSVNEEEESDRIEEELKENSNNNIINNSNDNNGSMYMKRYGHTFAKLPDVPDQPAIAVAYTPQKDQDIIQQPNLPQTDFKYPENNETNTLKNNTDVKEYNLNQGVQQQHLGQQSCDDSVEMNSNEQQQKDECSFTKYGRMRQWHHSDNFEQDKHQHSQSQQELNISGKEDFEGTPKFSRAS